MQQVLCAAAWVAACASASVQDAPPGPGSNRVVYDAAFYGVFAPRTALDMINQTPGFVFNKGDDQQRGFAGAVGNVLIDGERLSAKSQSLTDVLERVPAAEVQRIEILRGAEVAGDASGAAVLANVVRTRSANSGTWEAGTEVTNERHPVPVGHFAWSGRDEATQYSLGANVYSHDHVSPFVREVTDGAGEIVAERTGATPHKQGQYTLNGQLAMPARRRQAQLHRSDRIPHLLRGLVAEHHRCRWRAARQRASALRREHAQRRAGRQLAASGRRLGHGARGSGHAQEIRQ